MIDWVRAAFMASAAIALSSCSSQGDEREQTPERYTGIADDAKIMLGGTEPFWNMTVEGNQLTYSTPENSDGETVTVSRFSGNNGLGLSGELSGEVLQIAVTPGVCNDGMSDREYPFTATVTLGEAMLMGCGYTDEKPFAGDETP